MKWLARSFLLGWVANLCVVHAAPQTITLATALRLAGAQNLALEMARERVREARSVLDQDRHQLFPWVAPGLGYRRHDGNLQDVVGDVYDVSKQSGTAALTLRAQLELGDSIYRVLASKQDVRASEAAEAMSRRETLTGAAAGYLELSRAEASVAAADDSLRISDEFLRQVRQAVAAGLAFAGEAQRAEVQRERNELLRLQARAEVRVASARLAQTLRLPITIELRPDLLEFVPVVLIETNRALDSLVASAVNRRPELRRTDAQVAAARARRAGAKKGPWLPTLGAAGVFGGLAGGRNSDFGNGDDFQDYGLSLSWRLGPGGLGDRSRIRTANSRLRLAELTLEQERDGIIREVIEAQARAESAAGQLVVAGRALTSAQRLLDLTRARKEFGVGAVLEAIDAERELVRTRLDHIRIIAEHNRDQWEFWRVVGADELPAPGR